MQLVGFIVRIYHDARSPERQFITMHGQLNGIFSYQFSRHSIAFLLRYTFHFDRRSVSFSYFVTNVSFWNFNSVGSVALISDSFKALFSQLYIMVGSAIIYIAFYLWHSVAVHWSVLRTVVNIVSDLLTLKLASSLIRKMTNFLCALSLFFF